MFADKLEHHIHLQMSHTRWQSITNKQKPHEALTAAGVGLGPHQSKATSDGGGGSLFSVNMNVSFSRDAVLKQIIRARSLAPVHLSF